MPVSSSTHDPPEHRQRDQPERSHRDEARGRARADAASAIAAAGATGEDNSLGHVDVNDKTYGTLHPTSTTEESNTVSREPCGF